MFQPHDPHNLSDKIIAFTKRHKFPNYFDEILLESMEYCGYGSWKNISNRLILNYKPVITKHKLPIDVYDPLQIKTYYNLIYSFMFKDFREEYQFEISGKTLLEDSDRFYVDINNPKHLESSTMKNEKEPARKRQKLSGNTHFPSCRLHSAQEELEIGSAHVTTASGRRSTSIPRLKQSKKRSRETDNTHNLSKSSIHRPHSCSAHNFPTSDDSNSPLIDVFQSCHSDVIKKLASELDCQEILVYRPLRGDFEVEFDDNLEVLLADLNDEYVDELSLNRQTSSFGCEPSQDQTCNSISNCSNSVSISPTSYTPSLLKLRMCLAEDYTKYRILRRIKKKSFLQNFETFVTSTFSISKDHNGKSDQCQKETTGSENITGSRESYLKKINQTAKNHLKKDKINEKLPKQLDTKLVPLLQLEHQTGNEMFHTKSDLEFDENSSKVLKLNENLKEVSRIKERMEVLKREKKKLQQVTGERDSSSANSKKPTKSKKEKEDEKLLGVENLSALTSNCLSKSDESLLKNCQKFLNRDKLQALKVYNLLKSSSIAKYHQFRPITEQVVKKQTSNRERNLIGRVLNLDQVLDFSVLFREFLKYEMKRL